MWGPNSALHKRSNVMNKNLIQVQDWSERWYNRNTAITLPPLRLYGSSIREHEEVKYLGLTIAFDLAWNSHVNKVSVKTSSIVGLMKYHQRTLMKNVLEIIYKSCVLSIINYGAILYSLTTDVNLKKLDTVQYDAARAVLGAMRGSSKDKCLEVLGWIPLRSHFKILRLLFFAKIMKGLVPQYLTYHLQYHPQNTRYALRSNQVSIVEPVDPVPNDFFSLVACDWNELIGKQPNVLTLKIAKLRELLINFMILKMIFYIFCVLILIIITEGSRVQPTPPSCASKSADHVPSILIENLIQSSKTQLEQSKTLIDNHHDKIKTHVKETVKSIDNHRERIDNYSKQLDKHKNILKFVFSSRLFIGIGSVNSIINRYPDPYFEGVVPRPGTTNERVAKQEISTVDNFTLSNAIAAVLVEKLS
ncbi:unnamed protein product [Didymodactylos carnosus]|uniref:Uncharacterized protein n=1 Tax=Didymodactylos carnosus TaxID=1234261 RepID=A0A814F518_9BILA|nr:unnamed protein product [Didymodactylos carnosus]CAF3752900.1 unnamed protein product [Didymodactylos carnosus]